MSLLASSTTSSTAIWTWSAHCSVRLVLILYLRTSLHTFYVGAVNDINPSLRLGEDGINSVLLTLQSIRERALSTNTSILVFLFLMEISVADPSLPDLCLGLTY